MKALTATLFAAALSFASVTGVSADDKKSDREKPIITNLEKFDGRLGRIDDELREKLTDLRYNPEITPDREIGSKGVENPTAQVGAIVDGVYVELQAWILHAMLRQKGFWVTEANGIATAIDVRTGEMFPIPPSR